MGTKTNERIASVNGVELCYEAFGAPADSAILLLHGAGNSMLSWREEFCGSRPAGATSCATTAATPDARPPTNRARRSTRPPTPGDPSGESPGLPGPTPEIAATFGEEAALPDWADREEVVTYLVEAERPYAGSGGFDEEAMRALAERVAERTHNVAAMVTNPFMVGGGQPWRRRLGEIAAPTLVIHGADDPLFPLPHGEALAREIPGAELLVLNGVGHEYPPPCTWDEVVPAVLRHTAGGLAWVRYRLA